MISRRSPLCIVLALLTLIGAFGDGRAETLSGAYYGIDEAAGAELSIEPSGGGYVGTLARPGGERLAFEAARAADGSAEGVVEIDRRRTLLRARPLPFGAEVTLVPFGEDAGLALRESRVLYFVRRGLELPAPGPDFIAPPADDRGRISANGFLASYEFWPPVGVRNGYLSLPERFQTLMRLFPAVQLDVIWKLCLAPGSERALAVALRGQGVSCKEVVEGIASAQRKTSFTDYKREVAREKAILRTLVRCADGFPESREACDRAARELSAQAVSMETAAKVLARYR